MSDRAERQLDYGPQRASWTVKVRNDDLARAAERKLQHHEDRLAHWKAELKNAEVEMKESVQIREHQITGGTQHTTVFDQEKANYVTTCKNKVSFHEGMRDRFHAWAALLSRAEGTMFQWATVEDAEFFDLESNIG